VVWPLALLDLFREPAEATAWSRLHTRQAFVFGFIGSAAYLLLLALPLLIVIPFSGISTGAVLWIYAIGLLADVVGAIVLIAYAFSCRGRALNGELFAIPVATPIADRLFRLEK
jgi:uncharacterized membrane protein